MIDRPDHETCDATAKANKAEAILAAVRFAANRFLRSRDWREEIDTVLQQLGEAASVCRVGLYITDYKEEGRACISLQHSWTQNHNQAAIDNDDHRRIDMHARGLAKWQARFEAGQTIVGNSCDFPSAQKTALEQLGIQSIANTPILLHGDLWGVLGFHECRGQRDWSGAELDALTAAADTLSAAVERAQTEQAWRSESERMAELIQDLSLGHMRTSTDTSGRVLMANEAAATIFGFDSPEALRKSRPIDTYVDPADRSRLMEKFLRQGSLTREEIRCRRRDGSPVWLSVSWSLYRTPGGEDYIDALLEDITTRRETKQALQDKSQQLQTIVDAMPTGMYLKDAQGRFQAANRKFLDLAAVPLDEEDLIGKTSEDLYAAEKGHRFHQSDMEVMRSGCATHNHEGQHTNLAGQMVWTLNTTVPFHNDVGKVAGLVGFLHEVTDLKQAERRVRDERKLLRRAFDALPDAAYIMGLDGKYVLGNREFVKRMPGDDTESTYVGTTYADHYKPELARIFSQRDQRILATGEELVDQEHHYTSRHGPQRWTSETFLPYRNSQGDLMGVIGLIRDVTKQKLAEQRLREERQLLRTVIDAVPDALYVKDRTGRFLLVNRKFTEGMLQSKGEDYYLGKTDHDIFPPEKALPWEKQDQKVITTGQPVIEHERCFTNHDGSTSWTLSTLVPFRRSDNTIAGLVGVVRNNTDRMLAAERLRTERQLLRTVIDAIPAAIYVLDIDGRYVLVNKWFAEHRGGSPEETYYLGKTDTDLFGPERAAMWRTEDLTVMAGTTVFEREHSAVDRLGRQAWMLVNKAPLRDGDGDVVGMVGAISNITQLKRTEQSLQKERHLLRTVIDTIPSALYFKDLDGRFQLANKAFYEGQGRKSESEIVGKTDFELYSREKAEYCKTKDAELLASGKPVLNREVQKIGPDGLSHWRLFNSAPVPDGKGGFLGLIGIVDIITDKKRAEQAIRESEERFRTLSEQSLLSIAILQDSRFLYVNEAFCSLLGYSRDELLRWERVRYDNLLHPDDLQFVRDQSLRKQQGKGGVVPHYECRIVTQSGEIRWVDLYSKTIWQKGKPAVFVTFIDVTSRKEAEEAMRTSERQFREVLTTSRDVAYRLNLRTMTYDYVGAASTELMGYSPAEMAAMGFTEAAERFHPDDLQRLDEHFSLLLKGSTENQITPTIEYRWKRRNGQYRWFSDSRSVVLDDSGAPTAIVGSVRDITDRQLAEEALTESEARYRELFASVPIGLTQSTPGGDGTVPLANPAAARMFGYDSVSDFCATPTVNLYPSPEARQRLLAKLTDQEQIVQEEFLARRKDGADLWLSLTASTVRDAHGEVCRIDALMEDITERKRVARALQEAHSKLVAAREVERKRLATELHDSLGQSLVVLNLSIQGACDNIADRLDTHQLTLLRSLGDRCGELIREVRSMCHGLFPRVLDSLGLEAALRSLTRGCEGQLRAAVHYTEELQGWRFPDSVEIVLFRIAQEAISNVLRHSGADHVDLDIEYDNGLVSLSVIDNGCGFRIDDADTTGLGLTTMRERAEAVGGMLSIESQPGRTCVRVAAQTELREIDPD